MRAPSPSIRKAGPKTLVGSAEAKRQAAVVLEVLSGSRNTEEASRALGVALSRYYVLETRALQGLIGALEPRPKGRRHRPEDELAKLRRDTHRLERDLARTQALVRAAQRSMGIPAVASESRLRGKGRRKRRATSRAMRAVTALRAGVEEPKSAARAEVHVESKPATAGP
jgi:hypothetical protein